MHCKMAVMMLILYPLSSNMDGITCTNHLSVRMPLMFNMLLPCSVTRIETGP